MDCLKRRVLRRQYGISGMETFVGKNLGDGNIEQQIMFAAAKWPCYPTMSASIFEDLGKFVGAG